MPFESDLVPPPQAGRAWTAPCPAPVGRGVLAVITPASVLMELHVTPWTGPAPVLQGGEENTVTSPAP